jgi:hypothetical protein
MRLPASRGGPQTPLNARAAVQADASAVAEVLCESRRRYLPFAPMAHTDEDVRGWAADIPIPGGDVYVAGNQGQVVPMLAIATVPFDKAP